MSDEQGQADSRRGYWDRYYQRHALSEGRPLLSQFATFVAGELSSRHRISEFGCRT
ncbi:MAG TPA: hypothetical protein VH496_10810 [Mycobacterium sp.]